MTEWFNVKFTDGVSVWAHRLAVGDGIGVHNDNTPSEFRLVVQLNRGWKLDFGGIAIFFDSNSQLKPARAYLPHSNSAVAFRTDHRSYHAVTDVFGGTRYSLIFVFVASADS